MNRILTTAIQVYRRFGHRRYGWFGDYTSWQQASRNCTGYDAANILEKVKTATLCVKNGQATYERDSLLFDTVEYSWPLLAHLLWIAGNNNSRLSVVDFGGALGSSYFQNRQYLGTIRELKWSVVEQQNFVQTGREYIAGGQLQFFETIDETLERQGRNDVLLLSCVLPYLEKPYDFLDTIALKQFPYIIVDNTYFSLERKDRLTVQVVPPAIYQASYPAWFLDIAKVKLALAGNYELVNEFENDQFLYLDGEKIRYRGFAMKLKSRN
jgi:putative methyltransferase (TIGR04325 family)